MQIQKFITGNQRYIPKFLKESGNVLQIFSFNDTRKINRSLTEIKEILLKEDDELGDVVFYSKKYEIYKFKNSLYLLGYYNQYGEYQLVNTFIFLEVYDTIEDKNVLFVNNELFYMLESTIYTYMRKVLGYNKKNFIYTDSIDSMFVHNNLPIPFEYVETPKKLELLKQEFISTHKDELISEIKHRLIQKYTNEFGLKDFSDTVAHVNSILAGEDVEEVSQENDHAEEVPMQELNY